MAVRTDAAAERCEWIYARASGRRTAPATANGRREISGRSTAKPGGIVRVHPEVVRGSRCESVKRPRRCAADVNQLMILARGRAVADQISSEIGFAIGVPRQGDRLRFCLRGTQRQERANDTPPPESIEFQHADTVSKSCARKVSVVFACFPDFASFPQRKLLFDFNPEISSPSIDGRFYPPCVRIARQ